MATVNVSSWPEFVTAIQSNDNNDVVVTPANQTWDMNEILPTGLGSMLDLRAKSIQSNGLKIKNLFVNETTLFKVYSSGVQWNQAISGITFENLLIENGAFIDTTSGPTNYSVTFSLCAVSGRLVDSHLTKTSGGQTLNGINFYRCGLNLAQSGNSCINYQPSNDTYWQMLFNFCNINTTDLGLSYTTTTKEEIQLKNCLWTGDFTPRKLHLISWSSSIASYSIIDANVLATSQISTQTPVTSILYNSDKIASGVSMPSAWTGCTTEQIHNTAFLRSKGFPIEG